MKTLVTISIVLLAGLPLAKSSSILSPIVMLKEHFGSKCQTLNDSRQESFCYDVGNWDSINSYPNFKHLAPAKIYVDSTASLGGDGESWETAYRYLQDALAYAAGVSSAEIWVARGTYYPDEDEGGNVVNDDQNASFVLQNNVALYGGFSNLHTSLSQRNWNSNPTILSGDITQTERWNAYHIIYNNFTVSTQLDASAIFSGFILEGAIANYEPSPMGDRNFGAGMFNRYASPSISYCIFRGNDATYGAAIYNEFSNPVITNSIIHSNQAYEIGDAMFNSFSNSSIRNCTISENKGPDNGNFSDISIYNSKSNISITNCILWNNNIEIQNVTSTPVVNNSIVQGGYSGGIKIIDQDPLFVQEPNNFDLKICSPAINKGTNSISVGNKDFEGNSRNSHGTIDIGAYEFITGIVYVKQLALV